MFTRHGIYFFFRREKERYAYKIDHIKYDLWELFIIQNGISNYTNEWRYSMRIMMMLHEKSCDTQWGYYFFRL